MGIVSSQWTMSYNRSYVLRHGPLGVNSVRHSRVRVIILLETRFGWCPFLVVGLIWGSAVCFNLMFGGVPFPEVWQCNLTWCSAVCRYLRSAPLPDVRRCSLNRVSAVLLPMVWWCALILRFGNAPLPKVRRCTLPWGLPIPEVQRWSSLSFDGIPFLRLRGVPLPEVRRSLAVCPYLKLSPICTNMGLNLTILTVPFFPEGMYCALTILWISSVPLYLLESALCLMRLYYVPLPNLHYPTKEIQDEMPCAWE